MAPRGAICAPPHHLSDLGWFVGSRPDKPSKIQPYTTSKATWTPAYTDLAILVSNDGWAWRRVWQE
jgi:hypothetical protein